MRFRNVIILIILKKEKIKVKKKLINIYKLIIFLNVINKIIKKIINDYIIIVIKNNNLLFKK